MAGFFQPGKASVIVGGQFGSEAKGLAAAYLATNDDPGNIRIISTTNAGAQAGHTTVLADGRRFVCYHLPTIGVLIRRAAIYLNAGSVIDVDQLIVEVAAVSAVTGEDPEDLWGRIVIHPAAAIIQPRHRQAEASGSVQVIGSTRKGVGAALCSKVMREYDAVAEHWTHKLPCDIAVIDLNRVLAGGAVAVAVEIPQGTGLSINASTFYPHTTSRDCWVGQGLTDAGINPAFLGPVAMVCRTFPIRVGHIYGPPKTEAGEPVKLGDSGPFYEDSKEIDWSDLPGVEPERTTVTQRVRRIATWSRQQYRDALRLNRPNFVFLTFTNYLYETKVGKKTLRFTDQVRHMVADEALEFVSPAHVYSWGPRVDQCSLSPELALSESIGRLVPRASAAN